MSENNQNNNSNLEQNEDKNSMSAVLPRMALKDIPDPKENAQEIVALKKESGKVCGYKLSDGRIVDKQQGVELAKAGEIKGVGVSTRNGNEYLKSIPDGEENNNLSNLPSVSD